MTAPARELVLVVDDAPETLGALCTELEAEGCTVLVAASGEEALRRLDLVTPDAVLMDARMPGLDGFETCRRLKAQPAWAHIPVIFMTGLSETEHIVEGFDAGGVDYVVKPVRTAEVLARLTAHVRNARAARLAREAVDLGGLGVLVVDARGRVAWRSPQAEQWMADFFGTGGHDGADRGDGGDRGDGASRGDGANRGDGADRGDGATRGDGAIRRDGADRADRADRGHRAATRDEGDGCVAWLHDAERERRDAVRTAPDGTALLARRLGEVAMGETMWLLRRRAAGEAAPSRLATAALTPRETEVLSWIAKGKTNRDVAEILGLSPRTVNKHLEHVFEKLGVETRAAAAALASRELL